MSMESIESFLLKERWGPHYHYYCYYFYFNLSKKKNSSPFKFYWKCMLNQQQAGLLTVLLLSAASEEERPSVPGEFCVSLCVFCPYLVVGLVYLLEQNLFLPRIWAQPPKTRTSPCRWSRCRLANATKELDNLWFAWKSKHTGFVQNIWLETFVLRRQVQCFGPK